MSINNNVSVSYSVMQGGLFGGLPVFFVRPNDNGVAFNLIDFEDLAHEHNMKQTVVVVDITTSKFSNSIEPTKNLIETIANHVANKIIVIGNITADELPAWATSCTYLIANIMPSMHDQVLGFQVNEVRWLALEPELQHEPGYARSQLRLLELRESINVNKAITFLAQAQQVWGLLLPPKKNFEVDLT